MLWAGAVGGIPAGTVGGTLALGAAISMVIIAATTTVDQNGVRKEALTPALAKELGAWLKVLTPFAIKADD